MYRHVSLLDLLLTVNTETAFRDIKGDLYPTVGMKKPGEHIRVNFGQEPFVFSIDAMVKVRLYPQPS